MSVLAEVKKVTNHRYKIQTRIQKEDQTRLKDETEKRREKKRNLREMERCLSLEKSQHFGMAPLVSPPNDI